MNVAEYVVDVLIKNEVTDAFGIPGGVILDLLYAMEDRKQSLCPHLNYNEQASGFAASGYAQVKDSIGVAYATRSGFYKSGDSNGGCLSGVHSGGFYHFSCGNY